MEEVEIKIFNVRAPVYQEANEVGLEVEEVSRRGRGKWKWNESSRDK